MQLDIKQAMKEQKDFVVKFADNPFNSDGDLEPGLATPTFDEFLTRMVKTPVFMNQSTVIPMTSLEHNLDMFNKEPDFESQRNLSTGVSYGYADLTEVAPERTQKTLLARPLALKSIITQNFLDENIEKEDFLNTWTSYLAQQAAPAMERFGVFANSASTETVASGLKATDGILKQLLTINGGAQAKTTGVGNLVYSNEVADGIFRNINRYVDNDGDLDNATLVLPPQIYSRFMAETAADRDTPLGDIIWENGTTPKVMGIAIKQDSVLRNSPNGYDELGFTAAGEYDVDATADTDKMLYGFLSKPSNNVFGIMRDTEVKQEWSIDVLGYKTALLAKADAKVIFEEDTLVIPFTMNAKSA